MSMTSRQIVDITGKRHDNVKADVKKMIERGDISPLNFQESDYVNERGKS